jgi:hypothetical protein
MLRQQDSECTREIHKQKNSEYTDVYMYMLYNLCVKIKIENIQYLLYHSGVG